MNTTFVGIKEFRQNISGYVKRARGANVRFVVVNHNKPLFEVTPFAEDETLDSLFADILVAEEDIVKGKVYTQDAILAELK